MPVIGEFVQTAALPVVFSGLVGMMQTGVVCLPLGPGVEKDIVGILCVLSEGDAGEVAELAGTGTVAGTVAGVGANALARARAIVRPDGGLELFSGREVDETERGL